MNIKTILADAKQQLAAASDSEVLDAELLLSYVLDKPRSFLFAWPEHQLSQQQMAQFKYELARRIAGEPLAYIIGEKEFWSLPFKVNQHVLVPRPETEILVELVLALLSENQALQLADLGTGSGNIALSLAHSRPQWQLHAVDKSADALVLAQHNAKQIQTPNVSFYRGEWFSPFANTQQKFAAICSNPPYLAADDKHLPSLAAEPQQALVAADAGLADLAHIIQQAPAYLESGGYLLLEHGCEQASAVHALLQQGGFQAIKLQRDLADLPRISYARI